MKYNNNCIKLMISKNYQSRKELSFEILET